MGYMGYMSIQTHLRGTLHEFASASTNGAKVFAKVLEKDMDVHYSTFYSQGIQ